MSESTFLRFFSYTNPLSSDSGRSFASGIPSCALKSSENMRVRVAVLPCEALCDLTASAIGEELFCSA